MCMPLRLRAFPAPTTGGRETSVDSEFDAALRSDMPRLGSLLGQSPIRQEDQHLLELVEEVRPPSVWVPMTPTRLPRWPGSPGSRSPPPWVMEDLAAAADRTVVQLGVLQDAEVCSWRRGRETGPYRWPSGSATMPWRWGGRC
jgi:hypothetical protein